MRSKIVEYMTQSVVFKYQLRVSHTYLQQMQQIGTWGTENEIMAAAQLLDIAIICYSKYNTSQYRMQKFSPHSFINAECTGHCNHSTVNIVNSSGTHYNAAFFTKESSNKEE